MRYFYFQPEENEKFVISNLKFVIDYVDAVGIEKI